MRYPSPVDDAHFDFFDRVVADPACPRGVFVSFPSGRLDLAVVGLPDGSVVSAADLLSAPPGIGCGYAGA